MLPTKDCLKRMGIEKLKVKSKLMENEMRLEIAKHLGIVKLKHLQMVRAKRKARAKQMESEKRMVKLSVKQMLMEIVMEI